MQSGSRISNYPVIPLGFVVFKGAFRMRMLTPYDVRNRQ